MLQGLFGSILENNKLRVLIPTFLISLILYFVFPAICTLVFSADYFIILFYLLIILIFTTPISFLRPRYGVNILCVIYLSFAISISLTSSIMGTMFFYMMPDFSNIYVPLIYLAGYVVNFLLYFVFNIATDRDPMGPVIIVFLGFIVLSAASSFIALFAFNYPGIL